MKALEAVELLAHADELDRRAGDRLHRQRGAAARVAVELGEHDAGERQRFLEGLGRVDRVLALHRVDDEQRFHRIEQRVQFGDLAHHLLVDRQAPGGVHQQHVEVVRARPLACGGGDLHRLLLGRRSEELRAGLLRDGAQLLDGGRAIDVARDREHLLLPVLAQPLRELADGGGLARALQAGHQHDRRRLAGEIELRRVAAHQLRQLAVHDADQRLPRRQAADHLLSERAFAHARDEVANDRQRHVGFEQRDADFAQHLLRIGFGQARFAAHRLDDAREPLREVFEHALGVN